MIGRWKIKPEISFHLINIIHYSIKNVPEGNHTPLRRSAVCPPAARAPTPAGEPLPGQKPPDAETR